VLESFQRSTNSNRPVLSATQLGIDPSLFLCGIAYQATPRTVSPQRFTLRGHAGTPFVSDIADVQSSVTGSITTHAMAPFPLEGLIATRDDFRAHSMQRLVTRYGDPFMEMLRGEAMREVREETGLSGPLDALEQVSISGIWMTFKVNISSLRADNASCRAFAQARPAGGDFRFMGVPLKVQVYIYGAREVMKERFSEKEIQRPFVEAEMRQGGVAGVMVYSAMDAEQFRVV
jgi:hypothetical protein